MSKTGQGETSIGPLSEIEMNADLIRSKNSSVSLYGYLPMVTVPTMQCRISQPGLLSRFATPKKIEPFFSWTNNFFSGQFKRPGRAFLLMGRARQIPLDKDEFCQRRQKRKCWKFFLSFSPPRLEAASRKRVIDIAPISSSFPWLNGERKNNLWVKWPREKIRRDGMKWLHLETRLELITVQKSYLKI